MRPRQGNGPPGIWQAAERAKHNNTVEAHSTTPKPGSYVWRRLRGLLVISDHRRRYLATRHSRGPYPVPLPEDRL